MPQFGCGGSLIVIQGSFGDGGRAPARSSSEATPSVILPLRAGDSVNLDPNVNHAPTVADVVPEARITKAPYLSQSPQTFEFVPVKWNFELFLSVPKS